MSRRRAFSLLELCVMLALGSFITIMTVVALRNSTRVWTNTSSRDTAMRDLARARRALQTDLTEVPLAPGRMIISQVPPSLGGGADGDCIQYLSASNSTTGEMTVLTDGSSNPYFFENIYYYAVVPSNHDALFGGPCTGGNEGGYDYNCPHKVLLRGVANENPAFDPSNATTQDKLLSPLTLSRPTGLPKGMALNTVAINLLTFQVQRQGAELLVDLRAVALADAKSRKGVGTTSFRSGGYTVTQRFSIFPKN